MICLFVAMISPTSLLAQTPEEVVQRMTAELNKGESQGMSFDFVMTIPLLGEFRSTNYTLGEKMRMEMVDHGNMTISWSDGVTDWEYDSEKNEVKITKAKPKDNKDNSGNVGLFKDATVGYDLSFEKKTDDKVWYILCKKNRSNKDKDDPKKMYIADSKADYSAVYLRTKTHGIGISMENFKIGVTEEQVTFNPAEFPGAKIVDER